MANTYFLSALFRSNIRSWHEDFPQELSLFGANRERRLWQWLIPLCCRMNEWFYRYRKVFKSAHYSAMNPIEPREYFFADLSRWWAVKCPHSLVEVGGIMRLPPFFAIFATLESFIMICGLIISYLYLGPCTLVLSVPIVHLIGQNSVHIKSTTSSQLSFAKLIGICLQQARSCSGLNDESNLACTLTATGGKMP